MTNFIFKSQGTYKKLANKLEIIQSELRHQRHDNTLIISLLQKLITNANLQKQVDEYFDESPGDETSPQTDSEEQDGSSSNST